MGHAVSQNTKLKEAIDRMVEDSIRRILPQVMNEVLIKMIANSGVVQESRPTIGRMSPEQARSVRTRVPPLERQSEPTRGSLSELLDPAAGSDFYQDPRQAMMEATREERQVPPVAQRIQSLPPEFQQLAEGMSLVDDDEDAMWQPGERDSAVPQPANVGPPIDRAANALGLDFSRMKGVVSKTTPTVVRESAQDRAAKAQFEAQRIARQREQLNKPVG